MFENTLVLLRLRLQLDRFPVSKAVHKKLGFGLRKSDNSNNLLRGYVGALYVIFVKIEKPKRSESVGPSDY